MRGDELTGVVAAGDDVDGAAREPGLEKELPDAVRRERGLRGGLEDHHAVGSDRALPFSGSWGCMPESRNEGSEPTRVMRKWQYAVDPAVQPAASAGASFHACMSKGKFHGIICPTTRDVQPALIGHDKG